METSSPAPPVVGFIGLGDMGAPMAGHIVAAGYPLHVYDLRRQAMEPLVAEGAVAADSAAAAAADADVVVVCVVNAKQVAAVVAEHLVTAMRPGAVLVVTSSVTPEVVVAAATALAERKVEVLDCPVSGSRPAVAAGELTLMVGGDRAVLERVRAVLDTFAARVFHVGPLGAGQAMKVANNIMLHMNHLVALEALRFARSQGIDEQVLIEIANTSSGRSWVTETWGLIDQMLLDHPQAGTPGVHDMFLKEMWTAVELSRAARVSLPLTGLGVQVGRASFREREDVLGIPHNDDRRFG